MGKDEAYDELRAEALRVNKQLKKLKQDTDRSNPVDIDMIKTTKAMFYEKAIEVFRKEGK